ncbi:serine/threonine protein kinase [Pyxidicoccus xibeiensis]|uniref:serine/threonine protein kinase n=1 Tax=Pyxidicoccus xibeiensis TaxID=2906759 RepID=UPI0020A727A5|nr:serine/threonine protein kinase [Pyxidicoccus xibeiensis]MCP3144409.1 serine/threonine protein kinase [Pyxidicoccus xibeiensis]
MTDSRFTHLCFAVLLATSAGCTATGPGGVALRPDGTPGSEKCPEEALKAMRYLRARVGDGASVELDANQDDARPITLYDGLVESVLFGELGTLGTGTRLYGRVWTGGPQVVIRYYEAHPLDGDKVPICAVARLSKGQLRKLHESKPGMALLEFSTAGVFIVDEFR